MATIKQFKVVGTLPTSPEPDSIYYVQEDSTFSLYVTDSSGVPHPLGGGESNPEGVALLNVVNRFSTGQVMAVGSGVPGISVQTPGQIAMIQLATNTEDDPTIMNVGIHEAAGDVLRYGSGLQHTLWGSSNLPKLTKLQTIQAGNDGIVPWSVLEGMEAFGSPTTLGVTAPSARNYRANFYRVAGSRSLRFSASTVTEVDGKRMSYIIRSTTTANRDITVSDDGTILNFADYPDTYVVNDVDHLFVEFRFTPFGALITNLIQFKVPLPEPEET